MTFAGLVRHSLIDYPGLVACVVFVPGCNYDCFFCHNRQLIGGGYETLSSREVYAFLRRRAGLIDAVVISGGEPTLQRGLAEFLETAKSLGYRTKLDTNGSLPQTVESLIKAGLIDYAAVDYKAPASLYPRLCGSGADAAPVQKTIQILLESNIPFEVRTTVLPQLGIDELTAMAKELPVLPRYVLNRYRMPQDYPPEHEKLARAPALSGTQLQKLAESLKPWQPNICC